MGRECVVDTMVLQKANAPITEVPRERAYFRRRVRLLHAIASGRMTVLISHQLLAEYERQVRTPRNDFVRAFFEVLSNPTRRLSNWEKRWPGSRRSQARRCRYPAEDDHVLRTAIRPKPTTIFTEEQRMLAADACIYRHFSVHIREPE